MEYVFLNNSLETFTLNGSGAIATHVSAVRIAAGRQGVAPLVITRADHTRPPLDDGPRLDVTPAPHTIPQITRIMNKAARTAGWQGSAGRWHAWHVRRLLMGLVSDRPRTLVLHNDPDIADALARAFPRDTVLHVFHNVLPHGCSREPRVRHLAVSSYLAGAVRDLAGGTSPALAPNGVDNLAFYPAASSPDPLTVSFLGRTGREKGPDLLLDALLRIERPVDGLRLLLIGSNTWTGLVPDAYQQALADRIAELKRRGMLILETGHVGRPQVADCLRLSTVHVVPSRWEDPAPLVLMEAMASGLAIVAARSGGMPEYGGDACLWFERDDVEALTRQISRLLLDAALRTDLGRRARAKAETLTWDSTWSSVRALAEA